MIDLVDKPWIYAFPFHKLKQRLRRLAAKKPIHVMFTFVDHFEPWQDNRDPDVADQRMAEWNEYPKMAKNFADADGRPPKHSWFYLVEDWALKTHDSRYLQTLASMCYDGFGEIELHIHHGPPDMQTFPEVNTSETLRAHIEKAKRFYARRGALIGTDHEPGQRYAFIHGRWALDNCLGGDYCGVNDELTILAETGCYADFTMPSGIEGQARLINVPYYAEDDPLKPRSYATGIPVRVGGRPSGHVLMIPGPVDLYPTNIFNDQSIVEKANLSDHDSPRPYRIKRWVEANVHVPGRPEWVFVKMHTHGIRTESHSVCFGDFAKQMYETLQRTCNDGRNFVLHYVTARETYNIVKAAEAGCSGNPNHYRDFDISAPANTRIRSNVAYDLKSYGPEKLHLSGIEPTTNPTFEFRDTILASLSGSPVKDVLVDGRRLHVEHVDAEQFKLTLRTDAFPDDPTIQGASIISRRDIGGMTQLSLTVDQTPGAFDISLPPEATAAPREPDLVESSR